MEDTVCCRAVTMVPDMHQCDHQPHNHHQKHRLQHHKHQHQHLTSFGSPCCSDGEPRKNRTCWREGTRCHRAVTEVPVSHKHHDHHPPPSHHQHNRAYNTQHTSTPRPPPKHIGGNFTSKSSWPAARVVGTQHGQSPQLGRVASVAFVFSK